MKNTPDTGKTASYEHLMRARQVLLWALERRWTKEEATQHGCELNATENSAWLVLEGRARVIHDGHEFVANPGQWMFPKPGRRQQRFDGPFRFLSITHRWQWPDGKQVFESGLTCVTDADTVPWLEKAARNTEDVAGRLAPDVTYYLGHSRLTLAQSAELLAAAGNWALAYCMAMESLGIEPYLGITRDPRITCLLDEIREKTTNSIIDRSLLSVKCGWSARQIDRVVKQETGLTAAEFHDSNRYEYACRRLLERGLRIKEVAANLGYTDLAAFSRWFNRRAGCSPRVYRERF